MITADNLSTQLKKVPDRPGVYVFKDRRGKVLYVGKGRSLRKRIQSYFRQSSSTAPKLQVMLRFTTDFDFYVTDNETEALILECNLIKKHRPPFNVTYRDDKSYPYLAITLEDEFPRVTVTREKHRRGRKYYGPFAQARAIRHTLDTLRRIFPVRTCRGAKPGRQSGSPCLNYHIKRCLGPCTGKVSSGEYRRVVEQVCLFMEGREDQVIAYLEKEMKKAAGRLEFEKAAYFRNRLEAAHHVLEKQKIVSEAKEDRDAIGLATNREMVCVELFTVRQGRLTGSDSFILNRGTGDVLSSFVKQYYVAASFIPKEILLPVSIEDQELLESFLSKKRKSKVLIKVPQRGKKRKLVELAGRNAAHYLEMQEAKREVESKRTLTSLMQLQEKLALSFLPLRIECFDVSTVHGKGSVGSLVSFKQGRPDKSKYRRFRIKMADRRSDFAMMKEVVQRRFKRMQERKFASPPDLVIVDGGKPQLSAAQQALDELGIQDVALAALAKKEEQLFLPGRSQPVLLPQGSEALYLVKRIRDEAHRFAITYHRHLREKAVRKSILDGVSGVGPVRKKRLMNYFGSSERLKKASLEELEKVVPSSVARQIYQVFHSGGGSLG